MLFLGEKTSVFVLYSAWILNHPKGDHLTQHLHAACPCCDTPQEEQGSEVSNWHGGPAKCTVAAQPAHAPGRRAIPASFARYKAAETPTQRVTSAFNVLSKKMSM